jgi:hypothetical protein
MKRNDEVLFKLRDGMSQREIGDEIGKLSAVLHRLLEVCLQAGLEVPSPFLSQIVQGCGNIAVASQMANNPQGQQQPTIYRPQ